MRFRQIRTRVEWRAGRAIAARMTGLAQVVAHFDGPPRRHELAAAGTWTDSPETALRAQGLDVSPDESTDRVVSHLSVRIDESDGVYPAEFGIADATLKLLALICRHDRVSNVVETGVADGRTTFVLLGALRAADGRLTSIDVRPDVGMLVVDPTGWDLRITDGSPDALRGTLAGLGPLDLFIHDSDHGYDCQRSELEIGWHALRPGGWLVCDDADWSHAGLDFAATVDARPSFLHNARTVAMVLRKPYPTGSERGSSSNA